MLPPLSLNAWLRFDAIRAGLRRADPRTVLEVGAGQGAMGSWLARSTTYTGFEPDEQSRRIAAARIEPQGSVVATLPDGPVDMLCAFEVLEHIEDDAGALVDWHRRVTPGGTILLSVPAHRRRFGPCDQFVGHYRRYDRADIEGLLRSAGFEVGSVESYGTGLGHVLEAARNVLTRRKSTEGSPEERSAGSGRFLQVGERLAPVLALVAAPFRLLQRPFAATGLGVGWVVTARRP